MRDQDLISDDINLIGIAYTPLQANGLEVAYEYFERHGEKANELFCLLNHEKTGLAITEHHFTKKYNIVRNIDASKSRGANALKTVLDYFKLLLSKKINNSNIVFASAYFRLDWITFVQKQFPNKNVVFFQFDDGGGSYSNQFKDAKHLMAARHYSLIKRKLKLFKLAFSKLLESLVLKKMKKIGNYVSLKLFLYENNRYLINNEIANYYVGVFTKMANNKFVEEDVKRMNNCVLINSQPLDTNGLISGGVDLQLITDVCENIQKINKNITIYIKPHPRENITKYSNLKCVTTWENNDLPQEILLTKCDHKPKCIISFFSSTLWNGAALFGIKAISLAKMLLPMTNNKDLKETLNDYIRISSDFVLFPESLGELVNIIDGLYEG